MSSAFLDESNAAGQSLLMLLSRGGSIIAELLRLSENVPRHFRGEAVPPAFSQLIFDFSYLRNQDLYESRIENDSELLDRDAEFKSAHLEIIKRFYSLFEGVLKYFRDLHRYLSELDDGVYIQVSLETVLEDPDGRQMVCEAVYLWCAMLMLLDAKFEGAERERLVVSNLRYRGHRELPLLDQVCSLCKGTGFSARSQGVRPENYPEEYFARFPLPKASIALVLGRLRTDDLYHTARCYPHPDHRSVALAQQAGMIFLSLFLAPEVLRSENAAMREIVDRFFPDNWVVTWYLGFAADLASAWEPYKAAKLAVANTVAPANVKMCVGKNLTKKSELEKELAGYLSEGVLTEEYILDNLPKLVNCARQCNVTLRWLLSHSPSAWQSCTQFRLTKQAQQCREAVTMGGGEPDSLLALLLDISQFEWILKRVVSNIVDSRQTRWAEYRKEASSRAVELADFFAVPDASSGAPAPALTSKSRGNKNLEKWFRDIARQIDSLEVTGSTVASGRKLQQLKQALEEVEQYHQLEQSLQVRQFLAEVRRFLDQMLRVCNVGPQLQGMLDVIGDLSYAWDILRAGDTYVSILQRRIKEQPTLIIRLRAMFVKLGSILNTPLIRVNQLSLSPNTATADRARDDLVSASEYYSSELVAFVRRVLEVIPRSVFELLAVIISLITRRIPELPTRLEKDKVSEAALLDERFELAKATYSVGVFTEGIMAMENTLVGIIKINPKQLLDEGIRKELVHRLSVALDRSLTFSTFSDSRSTAPLLPAVAELFQKLGELAERLDGYSRSFQYIQDYIRMQGLRTWQEEFMRIVSFNVEQECDAFITSKRPGWQSAFQSREVPIPAFEPTDRSSVNFSGRLARQLLLVTDPSRTVYVPDMGAWYDPATTKELVGRTAWTSLLHSVSVFGVTGLDQLYSFMVVKELQTLLKRVRGATVKDVAVAKWLGELDGDLSPASSLPKDATRLYEDATKQIKAVLSSTDMLDAVCRVGQTQLLRKHIAATLNLACKTDSDLLHNTLNVLNQSLLKDIRAHYQDPVNLPYPEEDPVYLPELSRLLESSGFSDPLSRIYVATAEPVPNLALLCFLLVVSTVSRYRVDPHIGWVLVPTKKESKKSKRDSTPLVVGLVTLLKQFHSSHTEQFVALCGQYVRSALNAFGFSAKPSSPQPSELPEPVVTVVTFLEMFVDHSRVSHSLFETHIPTLVSQLIKQQQQTQTGSGAQQPQK